MADFRPMPSSLHSRQLYCNIQIFSLRAERRLVRMRPFGHLTAERCRYIEGHRCNRAGHTLLPWGTVSCKIKGAQQTRSNREHHPQDLEVCRRCTWKCSGRQRRKCGLLKSLGRCMAVNGNAMKIRTADWETAAPRYHRHGGGGGGERWILVERSTSGSVSEDPRRAERLCCTVKSPPGLSKRWISACSGISSADT